ncbi:MAG: hypothetical protein LC640_04360 [Frankia sp.]|nr:hypothetical protein [Frankia sp.]
MKTDPQSPLGQGWFLQFVPKGLSGADFLFLAAYESPTGGEEFVLGHQGPHPQLPNPTSFADGSATGVVDEAKSEVRITANIKDFGDNAKLLAPGSKISALTAEARRIGGQRAVKSQTVGPTYAPLAGFTFTFDDAESTKTYTAASPSCVAVGK